MLLLKEMIVWNWILAASYFSLNPIKRDDSLKLNPCCLVLFFESSFFMSWVWFPSLPAAHLSFSYTLYPCWAALHQGKNTWGLWALSAQKCPPKKKKKKKKQPSNIKKRAPENCHSLQCKSLLNVADLVNGMWKTALKNKNLIFGLGGISSSILSVIFTDKFALSQSDARISVAYKISQWKSLTKCLMKCPPDNDLQQIGHNKVTLNRCHRAFAILKVTKGP